MAEAPAWEPPEGSWASSAATRRVMQANRSRDTRPELLVRKALHASGLRYRVAVRPVADIRVAADIVFRGPRVAVFIDGCFWHGCPDHSSPPRTNAAYWSAKIAANRERDARAGRLLGDLGWTVIRVWEHEDPVLGAARIRDACGSDGSCRRPR
jgi:DNA mismatch endonuclease (patch repair protein)